jgi:nicotinamidase-related amidase
VLKPKHSGFFSTTLEVLLAYLGARTLVLTGVAGNICVLFTANDAYMRDYLEGATTPSDHQAAC